MRRMPVLAAGTALAALLAGGCAGQAPDSSSPHPAAGAPAFGPPATSSSLSLSWSPCRPETDTTPEGTPTPAPRFECATLTVPLDHAAPASGTIDIALIRLPATQPNRRIGSLVFNFGGPGVSGVDTLGRAATDFATLNTRYDLVSFDPRGIGRSAPVRCLTARQLDVAQQSDSSPDNERERALFLAGQRAFIRACRARTGPVLTRVGTIETARDMELLRAALGEDRLNYFGISYGTWLGANYAHQFPRQVGRMVLDAAIDPRTSPLELGLQQAAAFQRALRHYAAQCAESGPRTCPPSAGGKNADAIVADIGDLLERLDARPLNTGQGRPLSQSLGVTGVATALYSRELWPVLTQGLTAAAEGDGTILLALADAQLGREEDGTYSNLIAANTAISCADDPRRYTVADVEAALPRFERASPIFGPGQAWALLGCTGWPSQAEEDQDVSAPEAPPIVVIGNTGDPATPYTWAPALARELGSGVLVTLEGEGHGAYGTGNRCIRNVVDTYLLQGKVPANGTRCS